MGNSSQKRWLPKPAISRALSLRSSTRVLSSSCVSSLYSSTACRSCCCGSPLVDPQPESGAPRIRAAPSAARRRARGGFVRTSLGSCGHLQFRGGGGDSRRRRGSAQRGYEPIQHGTPGRRTFAAAECRRRSLITCVRGSSVALHLVKGGSPRHCNCSGRRSLMRANRSCKEERLRAGLGVSRLAEPGRAFGLADGLRVAGYGSPGSRCDCAALANTASKNPEHTPARSASFRISPLGSAHACHASSSTTLGGTACPSASSA